MNSQVLFHTLTRGFSFTVDREPLTIGTAPQGAATAMVARGEIRYDGEILSVTKIDSHGLTAAALPYRIFAARRAHPELFGSTMIRPLAVTGLTFVRDAILFGRRAKHVTQEAGSIELVPSGGVEASRIQSDGRIDVGGQLRSEFAEEVGWQLREEHPITPIGLVEDRLDGVFDVILALTLDIDPSALEAAHRSTATDEYSELHFIDKRDLADQRSKWGPRVSRATSKVMESYLLAGAARF